MGRGAVPGWFCAVIVFVAALAPARSRAELTPGTPAPDFTGRHVWINSKPVSLQRELRGKVVLVDFWEYTCINCIRTLPALKRIYARYKPYGFEIIGDHAPEFDFARRPENVAAGSRRERIPWPVIVDSHAARSARHRQRCRMCPSARTAMARRSPVGGDDRYAEVDSRPLQDGAGPPAGAAAQGHARGAKDRHGRNIERGHRGDQRCRGRTPPQWR